MDILAELKVSLGFVTLNPQIEAGANLSTEKNASKVTPESITLGKLNLPISVWIGSLNSTIALVEDAANQSISEMQRGFKITNVRIGDHYLILTINAPSPAKKPLQELNIHRLGT